MIFVFEYDPGQKSTGSCKTFENFRNFAAQRTFNIKGRMRGKYKRTSVVGKLPL